MADYLNVQNPNRQVTAAGHTYKDFQELAEKQAFDKEEMVQANQDANVMIQAICEKTHYFVRTEAKLFDKFTGNKISKPVIQSYRINEFDQMRRKKFFNGLNPEIVHDPTRVKDNGAITPGMKRKLSQHTDEWSDPRKNSIKKKNDEETES
jgi:hypothetical protein